METRYRATNLRPVLNEQGRSLVWLARTIGTSQTLARYIANGYRTTSEDRARTIAERLNVPIRDLFEETTDLRAIM